jgi:chemotaxis protein CheZ
MSEPAFDASQEDFDKLEEAVMATSRGRWFLKEYADRNRISNTKTVLDHLDQFQDRILQSQSDVRIEVLQSELREMANSISETRADIATFQSDEASADRIEAATGELDAIVEATENATSSILAAAEEMQTISEKMREAGIDVAFCDEVEMQTTEIFMSCSFQDLTGQRIMKVVNTLRFLEQRVNMMIEVWGIEGTKEPGTLSVTAPGDARPDASILDGPAKDGEGFSQVEIDAMLDGDFSSVDTAELYAAEEKAASVERKVEDDDGSRFNEVASVDIPDAGQPIPEAEEIDGADAGDDGPINQDDIDSLFG